MGTAGQALIQKAEATSQFVDGRFVQGEGGGFPVHDPSDATVVATLREASLDQVRVAVASARRAFDTGVWSGLEAHERAAVLRRFGEALNARAAGVTDVVVAEAGCPRNAAVMFVQVAAPLRQAREVIDYFLTLPEVEENPLPLSERVNAYGGVVQSLKRYTPVGVVAAIAAYNYPFFTAFWKVLPALVAGNCVILRPSPLTPISALFFAEGAEEAGLPPGVLNVILEHGVEGGRLLTEHPDVDMVAFTGSTAVGKQVMIQGSGALKRLQLELGGKSAQIFLPDAVEQAAGAAAGVCTAHAGQGCALGTRIFVPEGVKAQVLEQMAAALTGVKVGGAEDPTTGMGPLISPAQVERCERFVKLAVEAGARVVAGGRRPDGLAGYFFEPTVLDVPGNDNPAAQEEIFGPVVCVIGYRDLDHAVQMANQSDYGLSGYVFGKDRAKCLEVARRLRTGTVNINGGMVSTYASSGGQRLSGVGRERGLEGLRLYQQLSCLNIGA